MLDFQNYILKEYNLPNSAVAHRFVYHHNAKHKLDVKSMVPLTHNNISIKIEAFDEHMNKIFSKSELFVDGKIKRSEKDKLVNISPDELNNKFGKAKNEICSHINHIYTEKLKALNDDIDELKQYCSNLNSVIPSEFVNEPLITKTEESKNKRKFEF